MPLGRTKTLKHRIDTGNAKPHNCPPRVFGPEKEEIISGKLKKFLEQDVHEFRQQMRRRLDVALKCAAELDYMTRLKSKSRYDKNRKEVKFDDGDLVWIWKEPPASQNFDPAQRTRKLEAPCSGRPWRVIREVPPVNYELQHVRTGALDTFHVEFMQKLKKGRGRRSRASIGMYAKWMGLRMVGCGRRGVC